jgi:pseudouridine-5'-phosphate glycosidase
MLKYLLFISIFFTSCYSEKKASKQLNKVSNEYPVLISQKCGELFPPTIIKDTALITEYIQKIDTFLSTNTDTLLVTDTIKKECSISVKELVLKLQNANKFIQLLKVDLQNNPPYIVKNIIDTAKVFSLNKQIEKALKDKEDYKTRNEVMNKVCIWLLIIIIVLISYIYVIETKSKLHKPN